jgi:hypothetical protein
VVAVVVLLDQVVLLKLAVVVTVLKVPEQGKTAL